MKKGSLAAIVIGVLALGGIGGGSLLSNMAEQTIRARIAELPSRIPGYEASLDDVRVSLPLRTVRISNLRLTGPAGAISAGEVTLRPRVSAALGAIPSLRDLFLPASGPVVAGDLELRDVSGAVSRLHLSPLAKDALGVPALDGEASAASFAATDAHIDAALLSRLLDGRKVAFPDLVGNIGAARVDVAGLRLRPETALPDVSLDALRLKDAVMGRKIAQLEMDGITLASPGDDNETLRGDRFRMTDIAVPPGFAESVVAGAPFSPGDMRQAAPVFRTLTLENIQVSNWTGRVALNRLFLDWRGREPFHIIVQAKGISGPARISDDFPQPIPGMERLIADLDWEHKEQGEDFHETFALDAVDLGRLEGAVAHNVAFPQLLSSNPLALLGAQIEQAELSYVDKGGMARLLLAVLPGGDVSREIDLVASSLPSLLPGRDNRPLVEALRTTVLTPGTLRLRLKEGAALTALDFLDARELGRKLDAAATPGKENVKDQILRLRKQ